MKQHYYKVIKAFFLLAFIYLFPNTTFAQCAGTDTTQEICNFLDPSYQTLDLLTLLDGSPESGGTWADTDRSRALDTSTGILNVWAIRNSGVYRFTYTVSNAACGTTSTVLTLTIGAYAGVDNLNAAACETDTSVNLFQFYGDSPSPQANGTFVDKDASGAITGNFFNANAAGPGTYNISYIVPSVGSCPESRSEIRITVQPKPEPGIPSDFEICENEDLSPYTNFDLRDLLTGEDANGEWSELSGTTQLSSVNDHNINIQDIYTKNGPGTYSFVYTVYPSHPVCDIEKSIVNIIIEKQYNFSFGSFTVNNDICENDIEDTNFTATLSQPRGQIDDGFYNITYQVTNTTTGAVNSATIDSVAYNNATAVFDIDLDNSFFPSVANYKVNITQITKTGALNLCQNIVSNLSDELNIFSYPDLKNATITVANTCTNSDAIVTITNANVMNGEYQLEYQLSEANTANNTITSTFTGGEATFTIPAENITKSGNTRLTFTLIQNTSAGCENTNSVSTNFNVFASPDVSAINLNAANICLGEQGMVNFHLDNIETIEVTYSITGSNTVNGTSTINGDNGDFVLVLPTLQVKNSGNNTITITSLHTEGSPCTLATDIATTFTIFDLPTPPTVGVQPELCAYNTPTIANLSPQGEEYQWYSSQSSSTPLATDTPLENKTYWVSQVNLTSGCESEKVAVPVTLSDVAAPTLTAENTQFCGLKNPTIGDLSAKTNVTEGELIWYDAALNGNQLSSETVLEEGKTYYGYTYDASTGCFSSNHITTQVTLNNCNADDFDFYVPDGFSPNGDGINDTFTIPNINYIFPDYTLKIYNRYGKLLFEGNASTPDWDGRANQGGTPINGIAPSGVYFYILNFNKDNIKPKQGRIYLNQ
ncbi:gliding motility-associated C-terminal domain-containing protein [Zhouia sp. PK063]|uniref:T9SS type B sorting domain-containing protein n=1 Tax=Zhouia sp. PK063 TaxID=3373602 RepID=UPI003799E076